MRELAPGYKPVTIGHEDLPQELEEGLLRVSFVGIEVLTDSVDLHDQLSSLQSSTRHEGEALGALHYMTSTPLPLSNTDGNLLRRPSPTHPGDIYARPGLHDFYFCGNNKFGTLASMAYGIRSLGAIQMGLLGLHSALIFDQEAENATLIVGRNHVGKSTVGQAIEDGDDRFLMVADDWNEVALDSGTVRPVSGVFSPDNPGPGYEFVFDSFGKSFYSKHLPSISTPLTLSRIIELYDGGEGPEEESFILRSLTHIPFIKQPIDEETFACRCLEHLTAARAVSERKAAILSGYRSLAKNHETVAVTNDHSRNSLEEVVGKIKEIME